MLWQNTKWQLTQIIRFTAQKHFSILITYNYMCLCVYIYLYIMHTKCNGKSCCFSLTNTFQKSFHHTCACFVILSWPIFDILYFDLHWVMYVLYLLHLCLHFSIVSFILFLLNSSLSSCLLFIKYYCQFIYLIIYGLTSFFTFSPYQSFWFLFWFIYLFTSLLKSYMEPFESYNSFFTF